MHEIREHRLRQSRVTAVFEDRALSFILAKGATLEELLDRVAYLGRRHNARPVAITIKFGTSSGSGSHQIARSDFGRASADVVQTALVRGIRRPADQAE